MLTVTLDTGALDLAEALGALDGLAVHVATTTVTAREAAGHSGAATVRRLDVIRETWVMGESPWGAMVIGSHDDRDRFERLLLLLSGGGFPKPTKRKALTEGNRHLLWDAAMLSAHAREGRDLFVSDDTKAIGHAGSTLRARLLSDFGIQAMTVAEFRDYCGTLRST
jgi:hypothetical protein